MRRHSDIPLDDRLGLRARAGGCARTALRQLAPFAGITAIVVVVVSLVSAASPQRADAKVPVVSDVVGGIGDVVGGVAGGAAVSALKNILNALFGGFGKLGAKVAEALLTWLVSIPNFTSGNVAELSHTTTAVAFGLIGVVLTLSVCRYWLAGLSTSGAGGIEAIEGLSRTIGAAMFILGWPVLFNNGVAIANSASSAVLHSHGVEDDIGGLFKAILVVNFTIGANPVGWIVQILVALAGILGLLGLIFMKVVLSASTAVLFSAMPVAAILWAVPETSWIARYCARAFLVCLGLPFVWVVIFATFAAIGVDTLSFNGGGGVLDTTIIKPLTAVALLYLAVSLPRSLAKMALLGASMSQSGGFLGRTASYMAARTAAGAVQSHLPPGLGGPGHQAISLTRNATTGQVSSAYIQQSAPVNSPAGRQIVQAVMGPVTGVGAAVAGGDSAPDLSGAEAARNAQGIPGADQAPVDVAGAADSAAPDTTPAAISPNANARVNQPFPQVRFDAEMAAARQRAIADPPSKEQVWAAVKALTPAQQRAVGKAQETLGNKAQARMAYMATGEGLTSDQREAYRTLAGADKQAFTTGVTDALGVKDPHASVTAASGGLDTANGSPAAPAITEQPAEQLAAAGGFGGTPDPGPDQEHSAPSGAPSGDKAVPVVPQGPATAPNAVPPYRGTNDPPPRSMGSWFEK